MKSEHIQETFGNIDIYLFDQLLKGIYDGCKTVLDAGCGTGRNLLYFLRCGAQVYGVDQSPETNIFQAFIDIFKGTLVNKLFYIHYFFKNS